MAQQDVPLLPERCFADHRGKPLKAVATDGHRLAFNAGTIGGTHEKQEIIVPRKAVVELCKLLGMETTRLELEFSAQQVKATSGHHAG